MVYCEFTRSLEIDLKDWRIVKDEITLFRRRFVVIRNVYNSAKSKPIESNFFAAHAYEGGHLFTSLQYRKALRSTGTSTFSKIPV